MATDLNKVIIIGRFTKDPELRYTQGGTAVCSFSIANNKSWAKDGAKHEQVSFFNCVAWAKTGEVIAEYCKKGQRIGIDGRLQQRSWDDKDGNKRQTVEIVVDAFQFLSTKPMEGSDTAPEQVDDKNLSEPMPKNNPFNDDEIPF